jgi:phage terminase large subunit GpA-like protein
MTAYGASAISEWAEVFAPPPAFTVSEWARAHRRLPEASAARGGRWDNRVCPYLVQIMDSVLEPGARTISVMKAAQTGVSESVLNAVGFFIEHQPTPLLFVLPTASAAEAFSKERLADMIASTPALRRRVTDKRLPAADERPESTLTLKMFPGGFLALGASNSATTFARWAVRVGIADDCDRFPPTVGVEGDPADLLRNRTLSFHDGLTIFISTPTVQHGRIDSLFARSDQRRWVVPCQACGHATWVTWSDTSHWWVRYDAHDPSTARLQCPRCEASIAEPERAAWVARGAWQATAPPADPGAVGFHLPSMLSPFISLPQLVARWHEAQQRGRESLRTFVNTSLAEPWVEDDTTIRMARSEEALMAQREPYEAVPMAASWITAGLDVQDDRIEMLTCAWGAREECWVIAHDVLRREDGYDQYDHATWDRIHRELASVDIPHESGARLKLQTLVVDSGFLTPQVYRFSRLDRGHIFASKGVTELQDGHLIKFSDDRDSPSRLRTPLRLVLINTSVAKQRIADRIQDGRMHFPISEWCTEEFFAQLLAEVCQPVLNVARVRVGQRWIKQRPRNEALDLLVLNLAAREIRGTQDLATYRRQVGLPA